MIPTATENSKHSLSPSQISINLTLKGYLSQFLSAGYQNWLLTKITRHNKRQKTQLEKTEQVSEPDTDIEKILEL